MKQDIEDEEYLISRARKKDSRINSDDAGKDHYSEARAMSKAWLITSRLIFPKNFNLQYEVYAIEKDNNQEEEAAKTFKNLYKDFSQLEKNETNIKLWQEIDAIVEILSSTTREDAFLKRLFNRLPPETQREVLLAAAHNATDALERMKRLLLAFRQFPDLIPVHGGGRNGLEFMIGHCKQRVHQRAQLDDFVTLFMTDVAPLIISFKSLKIEVPMLHEILLLAFEFVFISLVHNKKEAIPWDSIISLFGEIGMRLGWPMAHNMVGKTSSDVGLYHQLLTLHQSQQKPNDITQDQIFYIGSLVFFKSLSDYTKMANGNDGTNGAILVEAFVTHAEQEIEPLVKRRRTTDDEKKIADVTHGDSGDQSPLVEAFLNAVRFYDLLASDPIILNRLQTQLRPTDSVIYPFFVDIAIYQGRHKEALKTLRHIQSANNTPVANCRFHLKSAALCFAIGDKQSMVDQVWQAFALLSTFKTSSEDTDSGSSIANSRCLKESRIGRFLTLPSHKYRHIHFLDFNRQGVISYAVKILYLGLKEKAIHGIAKSDLATGHILTFLQYSYPDEEDVISLIIDKIKRSENFTYPMFMAHIIHIDFLEMFSNILMESGRDGVTLDIAYTHTGAPAAATTPGRRLGTRGANRGEKNEIRSALRSQVKRAYDNLDDVIMDFVSNNRDSLFQIML